MCSRTPPASTVTTWCGTWRWSLAGATRRPARTTGGRVDGSAVGTLRPRRRAPRRRDPPVARPAAPPDQRLATTGPGDGPVGGRYPRAAGTGRHWRPAGHHSVGRNDDLLVANDDLSPQREDIVRRLVHHLDQ